MIGVAAAGASSCGVGVHHMLDAKSVGRQIGSNLASQYQIPAPAVQCPNNVPATRGRTFTCTTALDGQPLTINGTVTDGSGHFGISLTQAVLPTAHAISVLQANVAAQTHLPTTVTCGPRLVLVVRVGQTFHCTAHQGGVSRGLSSTVESTSGQVRYSLDPLGTGPGSTVSPLTAAPSPTSSSATVPPK
jgi:hypothetical protein